jgi:hypothetical protein
MLVIFAYWEYKLYKIRQSSCNFDNIGHKNMARANAEAANANVAAAAAVAADCLLGSRTRPGRT